MLDLPEPTKIEKIIFRLQFHFLRIKNNIIYFFQRMFRGYDDTEVWNLYDAICAFTLPRIKKLREVSISYPEELKSHSEWIEILDKIIWYLNQIVEDEIDCPSYNTKEYKKYNYRFKKGEKLFKKYLTHLWD